LGVPLAPTHIRRRLSRRRFMLFGAADAIICSGRGGYGVRFAPVLAFGSHRLRRPPPRSRRGNGKGWCEAKKAESLIINSVGHRPTKGRKRESKPCKGVIICISGFQPDE